MIFFFLFQQVLSSLKTTVKHKVCLKSVFDEAPTPHDDDDDDDDDVVTVR